MNPCCNYCWNAYYVSVIDGKHIGICEKCRTKKMLTRKERDDYIMFQEMSRPCGGDCPGNCYFEEDKLRFKCGICWSKKYITRDEYISIIERAKSKIAEFAEFDKLKITEIMGE